MDNPIGDALLLRMQQWSRWDREYQEIVESIYNAAERTESAAALEELHRLARLVFEHFDGIYSAEGARVMAVYKQIEDKIPEILRKVKASKSEVQ